MKIKRLQILFYLLLIWGGSTVTAIAHMSNYSYSDIKIRGRLIKYELLYLHP